MKFRWPPRPLKDRWDQKAMVWCSARLFRSNECYCPATRIRDAKDFLVRQTAEQAALEHAPLSDLEKRMMYFTETDECPEGPVALNDAFEAEYDNDEYEAKISKLMHHAFQRIKNENPEGARRWKEVMRELSKGDHYILVLCKDESSVGPTSVFLKFPVLASIAIALLFLLVAIIIGDHYGIFLEGGGKGGYRAPIGVHTPMPLWLKRLLWFSIVGGYLYYVILPWISKRPLPGLMSVLSRLFRRESRSNPRR